MPFQTVSQPISADDVITNVWSEPWAMPFNILPLGPSFRWVGLDVAKSEWPTVRAFRNPTKALNLGGTTVFVPSKLTHEDWGKIVKGLGFKENEQQK
jgi:hypothetical protein